MGHSPLLFGTGVRNTCSVFEAHPVRQRPGYRETVLSQNRVFGHHRLPAGAGSRCWRAELRVSPGGVGGYFPAPKIAPLFASSGRHMVSQRVVWWLANVPFRSLIRAEYVDRGCKVTLEAGSLQSRLRPAAGAPGSASVRTVSPQCHKDSSKNHYESRGNHARRVSNSKLPLTLRPQRT